MTWFSGECHDRGRRNETAMIQETVHFVSVLQFVIKETRIVCDTMSSLNRLSKAASAAGEDLLDGLREVEVKNKNPSTVRHVFFEDAEDNHVEPVETEDNQVNGLQNLYPSSEDEVIDQGGMNLPPEDGSSDVVEGPRSDHPVLRELYEIPYDDVKTIEDELSRDIRRGPFETLHKGMKRVSKLTFDLEHPISWNDDETRDNVVRIHKCARHKGCRVLQERGKRLSDASLKARMKRLISSGSYQRLAKRIVPNSSKQLDGYPEIERKTIKRKGRKRKSKKARASKSKTKETDSLFIFDGYHGDACWPAMYYATVYVQAEWMGKTRAEAKQLAWLSIINLLGVECGFQYGEAIDPAIIKYLLEEDEEDEEVEDDEGIDPEEEQET